MFLLVSHLFASRHHSNVFHPDHAGFLLGTGPNEHIGNVHYRALVRKATNKCGVPYSSLSSTKKRDLAKEVVASVKAMGGRFMKHTTHIKREGRGTTKCYVEVPDNVAIDKVKQGFRHQISKTFAHGKKDINQKTDNRAMIIHTQTIQKTKHGQLVRPARPIVVDMENTTTSGTSGKIITDTMKPMFLDLLPSLQSDGATCAALPSLSILDNGTAFSRLPDFRGVGGMLAPSILVTSNVLPAMNYLGPVGGELANALRGHFDDVHHGLSRSTLLLPDYRWPALAVSLSTMVNEATFQAPFLRRSSPSLPPQHSIVEQISSLTSAARNIAGSEGDPSLLGLVALQLERSRPSKALQHNLPAVIRKA